MKSDKIKNSIQRGKKKSKRKEELQVDKMKIDIGKIPHECYDDMFTRSRKQRNETSRSDVAVL